MQLIADSDRWHLIGSHAGRRGNRIWPMITFDRAVCYGRWTICCCSSISVGPTISTKLLNTVPHHTKHIRNEHIQGAHNAPAIDWNSP